MVLNKTRKEQEEQWKKPAKLWEKWKFLMICIFNLLFNAWVHVVHLWGGHVMVWTFIMESLNLWPTLFVSMLSVIGDSSVEKLHPGKGTIEGINISIQILCEDLLIFFIFQRKPTFLIFSGWMIRKSSYFHMPFATG